MVPLALWGAATHPMSPPVHAAVPTPAAPAPAVSPSKQELEARKDDGASTVQLMLQMQLKQAEEQRLREAEERKERREYEEARRREEREDRERRDRLDREEREARRQEEDRRREGEDRRRQEEERRYKEQLDVLLEKASRPTDSENPIQSAARIIKDIRGLQEQMTPVTQEPDPGKANSGTGDQIAPGIPVPQLHDIGGWRAKVVVGPDGTSEIDANPLRTWVYNMDHISSHLERVGKRFEPMLNRLLTSEEDRARAEVEALERKKQLLQEIEEKEEHRSSRALARSNDEPIVSPRVVTSNVANLLANLQSSQPRATGQVPAQSHLPRGGSFHQEPFPRQNGGNVSPFAPTPSASTSSSAPALGHASAGEPTAKPRPAPLVVPTAASSTPPPQPKPIQAAPEVSLPADASEEIDAFEESSESTEYGLDLEL
jgi:hypothetical protein